ncbi:tetratricopeptide repeat protein [Breznakiellaceae bacterium SP9]
MNKDYLLKLCAVLLVFCVLTGCQLTAKRFSGVAAYYLCGTKTQAETLDRLFGLLEQAEEGGQSADPEDAFVLVREIANEYALQKEYGVLINFLSSRTQLHPNDPYNSYYYLMIAYAFIQKESYPVAAIYFDRILKNCPDLIVAGESIHKACLRELLDLTQDPALRAVYYEDLISRFSGSIDRGVAYFNLAQAYERIGEWKEAIKAYTEYLPFRGSSIINGFPYADRYAKQLVDFNNSSKDWTFESLTGLVSALKQAMNSGSSAQIRRYQAKVNFFARSWGEEEGDNSGADEFNLTTFMNGEPINYSANLDAGSNANEAYLRTSGWTQYISTWYLFFRKIYFPQDPEIHGRWEWAGVFYGEKL